MSKRGRVSLSETHVKRGDRRIGLDKELVERLGRNDPCPCGSGRRFQALLPVERTVRWLRAPLLPEGLAVLATGAGAIAQLRSRAAVDEVTRELYIDNLAAHAQRT